MTPRCSRANWYLWPPPPVPTTGWLVGLVGRGTHARAHLRNVLTQHNLGHVWWWILKWLNKISYGNVFPLILGKQFQFEYRSGFWRCIRSWVRRFQEITWALETDGISRAKKSGSVVAWQAFANWLWLPVVRRYIWVYVCKLPERSSVTTDQELVPADRQTSPPWIQIHGWNWTE